MARNAGERVIGPCPYCGERYMRTNWMKRSGMGRDAQGRPLSDTHLIACHKRYLAAQQAKAPEQESKRPVQLTARMRQVLEHAAAGRPLDTGISGRSEYGGLAGTVLALQVRGLLAGQEITKGGLDALAQEKDR